MRTLLFSFFRGLADLAEGNSADADVSTAANAMILHLNLKTSGVRIDVPALQTPCETDDCCEGKSKGKAQATEIQAFDAIARVKSMDCGVKITIPEMRVVTSGETGVAVDGTKSRSIVKGLVQGTELSGSARTDLSLSQHFPSPDSHGSGEQKHKGSRGEAGGATSAPTTRNALEDASGAPGNAADTEDTESSEKSVVELLGLQAQWTIDDLTNLMETLTFSASRDGLSSTSPELSLGQGLNIGPGLVRYFSRLVRYE